MLFLKIGFYDNKALKYPEYFLIPTGLSNARLNSSH